jgi:flagellar basal-body rod protein FlgF
MLRGIYTAAAGMNAVQLATDTLANNIANVSTTGFKTRRVQYQAFPEMLINRINQDAATPIGTINSGVQIGSTPIHMAQGALRQTGNPLDVAIEGDGLFEVQLGDGSKAYTRVGAFTLNDERTLVTTEGYAVMDTSNQPIVIPARAGNNNPVINEDGSISNTTGETLGTIKRVRFANPKEALSSLGDSLFTSTKTPETLTTQQGGKLVQGFLEQSNTNVVSEMMQSMIGLRLYESLQRSITSQNQTLEKAVTEVGRI